MFHCRYCHFTTALLKLYLDHRKLHSSLNNKFICGFNKCNKIFKQETSLRAHLFRTHNQRLKKPNSQLNRFSQTSVRTLFCSISSCKKEFEDFPQLIKHLKDHIRDGLRIQCPHLNCKKYYTLVNSFASHLSKCHKVTPLNDQVTIPNPPISLLPEKSIELDNEFDYDTLNNFDTNVNESILLDTNEPENQNQCDNLFLLNLAQFFLKLEAKFFIPISTVQCIVEEICNLQERNETIIKANILTHLKQTQLSAESVDDIINECFLNDTFLNVKRKLETNYKRRNFYKQNFPYVDPIEIKLENDKNSHKFFHYVPILETLEKQLNHNKSLSIVPQCNKSIDDKILRNYTDGSVFKGNAFFSKNPENLQVILFQDAFEVVNPLGSAKSKYKIIGIYMNIGNFPDHVQSRTNSMQLVALCREKFFNHEKVYGRIVDDLKKLEDEGIKLLNGKVLKGSLVFISGDNLGSHSLGGFLENFSKAKYFCRFCLMSRVQFHRKQGALKSYRERSIESYEKSVKNVEKYNKKNTLQKLKNKNSQVQMTKTAYSCEGIKFNSAFNRLKHYHVCSPGLPPCLGHDLFEGVVAYDLKLFIDYFIKKKCFTLKVLNDRIDSFKYSQDDLKDKPCAISKTGHRILGGACQVWTFQKLFPLMVIDKIDNVLDDVWNCVLLLNEIVEIVCAPAIHISCISYLKLIIEEYILLRSTVFNEPLRPKHHYLTHYPGLILAFGPLIKVWTLRFESKHSFFKQCIRLLHNFLNITKSLSIKHELFQSYIRMGGDAQCDTEVFNSVDFNLFLYNQSIQQIVKSISSYETLFECNEIKLNGLSYRKQDAILVFQKDYQYGIEIGKIIIILHNEDEIYFIVEVLKTEFDPHTRRYELGETLRYECVPIKDLYNTQKLHVYKNKSSSIVKPKFGFVTSVL